MRPMELDGVRIEIVQADITALPVDAVVNAANNHFWMGGGVAGAIKRAGGGDIETEAMSLGPVSVGEAVVTRAGTLHARYVIHAAVMGQDRVTTSAIIARATRSSLERADELGVGSVAFPAFGTGVGGCPPSEAARAMMGAMSDFIRTERPASLRSVVLALFSEESRNAFERALGELK